MPITMQQIRSGIDRINRKYFFKAKATLIILQEKGDDNNKMIKKTRSSRILTPFHVANKRKERAERKFKLEEERKLKAKEVDEEWRWRCWLEDYKYYLEHDFNYQDFEDRIFYLDKLLNNEVRIDDVVFGDPNLPEMWLSVTGKDVDVLSGRKKVVTWGENIVHEFKERRTREKLWRCIKKVIAKLGEREIY
ncbi:hypothetical protein Glove_177g51 [Diversispora epigaea]|uniref:Uncharacterized protein n=1 Tax=Diversispora epigaea TaxID=1348612 RepID=A0A397IWL8_9GLOM|nr:hypothetical protein Glove_177g51 [Diversispora epigaea]